MDPKMIPRSDDEIILAQRLWFSHNPDLPHRAEVQMILESPYLQGVLRRILNTTRVKLGKPFITDREFQRLLYLMNEGTNV